MVNEESCLQESWEGGTGGWVLLLGSAGMQASLCPRGNRMARGHTVCWGRGAALDDSSRFCCWKKPSGKERASPYPYCAFLRLSQLIEIRENPSLPTGCECKSFYPKPLRASTLCAGKYSISILYQYVFGSCGLCWGGVSLRAGCRAHKLHYSSNPFALACPILHAAGNVGQAGFWDYLVLCKASSLCAFRKSLLLQQAGDWGWLLWQDAVPCPQHHPQGHGSTCVCSALLCVPHTFILWWSLNHLVTVILDRDHISLPDPFLHGNVVTWCKDSASFAVESVSHIFQTDQLFAHQSCPLRWCRREQALLCPYALLKVCCSLGAQCTALCSLI